jgi:hypothetical protein
MTEEIINAVERCKFITSDGICKNPINTKQKYCDEVPEDWCYYRQYTELKQENKELRDSKFKELDRALEAEDKYKSALEEIRELVKGHKVADEVRLKSILDEINECIGE